MCADLMEHRWLTLLNLWWTLYECHIQSNNGKIAIAVLIMANNGLWRYLASSRTRANLTPVQVLK